MLVISGRYPATNQQQGSKLREAQSLNHLFEQRVTFNGNKMHSCHAIWKGQVFQQNCLYCFQTRIHQTNLVGLQRLFSWYVNVTFKGFLRPSLVEEPSNFFFLFVSFRYLYFAFIVSGQALSRCKMTLDFPQSSQVCCLIPCHDLDLK